MPEHNIDRKNTCKQFGGDKTTSLPFYISRGNAGCYEKEKERGVDSVCIGGAQRVCLFLKYREEKEHGEFKFNRSQYLRNASQRKNGAKEQFIVVRRTFRRSRIPAFAQGLYFTIKWLSPSSLSHVRNSVSSSKESANKETKTGSEQRSSCSRQQDKEERTHTRSFLSLSKRGTWKKILWMGRMKKAELRSATLHPTRRAPAACFAMEKTAKSNYVDLYM